MDYNVTEQQIRDAFPEISFPATLPAVEGYAVKFPYPKPIYNPMTQAIVEIAPELTVLGHWEQRWTVVALPQDQVAANQSAATQALIAAITTAAQDRLTAFAGTRGYSSTDSISKYQNISDAEIEALPTADQPMVAKFRAECRYLAVKIAQTWAVLYAGLVEVQAGTRPMPSGYAEVENELPELVWPA